MGVTFAPLQSAGTDPSTMDFRNSIVSAGEISHVSVEFVLIYRPHSVHCTFALIKCTIFLQIIYTYKIHFVFFSLKLVKFTVLLAVTILYISFCSPQLSTQTHEQGHVFRIIFSNDQVQVILQIKTGIYFQHVCEKNQSREM
jgi:hypothetical protein